MSELPSNPEALAGSEQPFCEILVVDDDADSLAEYKELVETLGYQCHVAGDAAMALRLIARERKIGIVMTDIAMPGIDGLTLLEELSQRFMPVRPMVALVITGAPSLERAIHAMRSNALDFLPKPIDLKALSSALRRASARWVRLAAHFRLITLNNPGPEVRDQAKRQNADAGKMEPSLEELRLFADRLMKSRQNRTKFFDPAVLSGPAWDILLDLASAGLKGEAVPASSACAATQAPLSTALRHVNQLVEAGLVKRQIDQSDKRRTLLELEPHALEMMVRYLAVSWEALAPKQR